MKKIVEWFFGKIGATAKHKKRNELQWKNLGVAKPNNYVQMLTNVAHEIESSCVVSRENGNRLYKEKTSSGN
ncbi:hypothetical protein T4C_5403 [Trichinella pseudospiralis]|uniref:Uncharacterized protein n=1 Tax=Trichinella pseudospiralis TaxID=6337 RepID=A0A0V1GPY6_TRIPS|nr:hypothetical protein T4C_5403 [Trichinella pseudospiralis]